MITQVARKEFTEITRDGRFLWTSLIIIVLLLVSMGVGAQRYAEDRRMRVAAAAEDRGNWLNQGTKGPHTAAHYGVYAFKPATPLALFDPGYNDYTGVLQYLEAHKENQASFKPAADATALQRFGDLSGAMVLQLLAPLLIILLCFAMISGEREDGTLRQLLAIGVRRRTIVWGKALGVAMALGVVLIPGAIVGGVLAGMISGAEDPHVMVDFPAKLAVLGLAYVVFFAILICVSLSVSIVARSSGAALTILVAFWIVAGLLVPRVASDVGKALYPTPSGFDLNAAIDAGRAAGPRAHEPNHPNYIAFRQGVLDKYKVSRIEDLPFSFTGYALQQDEEVGFKVFDRVFGGVRRSFEKQDRVHQAFSVLSPFVAIRSLSAALAGTDVKYSNDFSEAGEAYRRNMVRILNEDLMSGAKGMTVYSAEWGYRANQSLWDRVPPFDFDPPGLGVILQRNILSIVVLAAWFVGSLGLLGFLARRARVDA